jgi:hypothetical protein
MEIDACLAVLRDFVATARKLEQTIPKILPPRASGQIFRRSERLRDAVARARRQAGHLAADLVLADAECWKEIEIRRRGMLKGIRWP